MATDDAGSRHISHFPKDNIKKKKKQYICRRRCLFFRILCIYCLEASGKLGIFLMRIAISIFSSKHLTIMRVCDLVSGHIRIRRHPGEIINIELEPINVKQELMRLGLVALNSRYLNFYSSFLDILIHIAVPDDEPPRAPDEFRAQEGNAKTLKLRLHQRICSGPLVAIGLPWQAHLSPCLSWHSR